MSIVYCIEKRYLCQKVDYLERIFLFINYKCMFQFHTQHKLINAHLTYIRVPCGNKKNLFSPFSALVYNITNLMRCSPSLKNGKMILLLIDV